MDESIGCRVPLLVAQEFPEGHWLNEPKYEWFRRGYEYATTQTRAIPALSKVNPAELYFAVAAVMRGAKIRSEVIHYANDRS